MKNILKTSVLLFSLLIISGFLNSCKKGENDPALSFRSRTQRLCTTWDITYFKSTYTSATTGAITTTINETFENGSYTKGNGTATTEKGSYVWTINIDKNGTYTHFKVVTPEGGVKDTTSESGNWFWADANKQADLKNKEMVNFSINQSNILLSFQGNPISTYSWVIDQLKHKEMVVKCNFQLNNGGAAVNFESTYTLTKN
jgi:hypothetical protein